jgi:hypothetical protein
MSCTTGAARLMMSSMRSCGKEVSVAFFGGIWEWGLPLEPWNAFRCRKKDGTMSCHTLGVFLVLAVCNLAIAAS